jgi:hypothetical protein
LGFTTYESRISVQYRLSRFSSADVLYASGYTKFTPRPRLSGEVFPSGSYPLDAQGASPTEAISIGLTHYLSPKLRVRGAWELYDGFFWNFEDSDFAVVDGKSARWWFSISDRLSDALSVRFKLTEDLAYPKTWVQSRASNSYPTADPLHPDRVYSAEDVTKNQLSFRIQVDYIF